MKKLLNFFTIFYVKQLNEKWKKIDYPHTERSVSAI